MKYGVLFALLAFTMAALAVQRGGWCWTMLYPAMSFGVVAAAYLGFGTIVFGKQRDGRLSLVAVALLFPYLLYVLLVWHALRIFLTEREFDRLGDELVLSRRLLGGELPPEVRSVIDLTCEFCEPKPLREVPHYRSFPMLDGSIRSAEEIRELAAEIKTMPKPVLIHCAQGHGRTGLIAAATLILSGEAKSADEAMKKVQAVRPGARLNREQRRMLERIGE